MAKATKMAVKSSAKSAKSTSSSVSKGSLGTIGDLRSKYRQDLIETIADVDEEVGELFLMEEEITKVPRR